MSGTHTERSVPVAKDGRDTDALKVNLTIVIIIASAYPLCKAYPAVAFDDFRAGFLLIFWILIITLMVVASSLFAGVTEDSEKSPKNKYRANLTILIAGYVLFLITLFPFGKTGVEASQAWLTVSLLAIGGLFVLALHLIFNSSMMWRKRLAFYMIVILVAVLAVAGTVV